MDSPKRFYSQWIEIQERQLQEMKTALNGNLKQAELARLVSRVLKHYRACYVPKESSARHHVLQMMSPSWRTPLENAFLWLGGWRPTMLVQFAYTEAGYQLEAELADILQGIDTLTMATLSSEQLTEINSLQTKTQEDEEALSQRLAVLQQNITELPLFPGAVVRKAGEDPDSMEAGLFRVVDSLGELLTEAESLRFETLEQMIAVLTVSQSAHYLVAVGQAQVSVREVGLSLY